MRTKSYLNYSSHLREYARKLRKHGTLGEVILWKSLKKKALGMEFHRQVPIDNYIVDFYCHELHLAIEIDGSHHDHPDAGAADVRRREKLESLGVQFLRFSERDVRYELHNVVSNIRDWIADRVDGRATSP
ncbi:MAG: DUF559 domain-containing protein [Candidatus Hydrogenedentes bacterium]|nr:DUF559 domain-containing protein [Candidatus Hydrogenedentota bacterium]